MYFDMPDEVVISGMSGRFPEAESIDEFRTHLLNGTDMVTEDNRRWEPGMYGLPRRSGKLKELTKFDAAFFGHPPRQAKFVDPQLRALLEVTYETLLDAGVDPQKMRGSKTGVFIGCGPSEVMDVWSADIERVTGYEVAGCAQPMFANRLSYFFDFRGPSWIANTYCSASLVALDQALRSIQTGQCDAAIVGGTNLCLRPSMTAQFHKLGLLSPDGACKSFDASANGYVRSETIAVVYLQKKPSAKRIYATLVHTSTNADGHNKHGVGYPSGEMQKRLLLDVYARAGVDPSTVSYVELHGTGTAIGDPQEANSVADVFCGPGRGSKPLLIGTVKSNMGHAEQASGLAALVKVLISMHDGVLPANLHYNEPNPAIPGLQDGRLKVVKENMSWDGGYAAINSFGFGGANAHALLCSPHIPQPPVSHPAAALQRLVTLSGRVQTGVERMLTAVASRPEDVQMQALLQDSVGTQSPITHPFRGTTIVNSSTSSHVVEKLLSSRTRKLWCVFSGMGTQWSGMGRDLMNFDVFRESITKSDAVLCPFNIHLKDMLLESVDDTFAGALNSFIAIASIQIALVDTLRSLDIQPDGIVGHSVGELACAYADECLTAEETILAAYWRGRCVEDARLPAGGMAVVGMTWEEARRRCPEGVVPACHNSHDTVTISGPAAVVTKFTAELQREGVFAREVQSAGHAFHSYCMLPASHSLKERLQQVIRNPRARSSRWISSSVPESDWGSECARYSSADYHVNNFTQPVLFHEALAHIPADAIVLEIAPHSLLQAVLRRGLNADCTIVGLTDRRQADTVSYFLTALGKLYLAGVNFNPLSLYSPVEFPVSHQTPTLSPLVCWDHTSTWDIPTAADFDALGNGGSSSGSRCSFEIDYSSTDSKDAYLADHVIEGRVIFPASGYLVLVWRLLSRMSDQPFGQMPVTFEDVYIHRATILPSSGFVKLDVNISSSTGQFEVCENRALVVSGRVFSYLPAAGVLSITSPVDDSSSLLTETAVEDGNETRVDAHDIYKELRLHGYEYGPEFRCALSANVSGTESEILWTGNWVSFLDTMLHMTMFEMLDVMRLPTKVSSLHIDPKLHEQRLRKLDDGRTVLRYTSEKQQLPQCTCGGVDVIGLWASVAPRRQGIQAEPWLKSYSFVPFMERELAVGDHSLVAYAQLCSRFALERMRQLVETTISNGLHNVALLQQMVTAAVSMSQPSDEELDKFKDAPEHVLLSLLDKIYASPYDEAFAASIDDIIKSSWLELIITDPLMGFARSDRCLKSCLDIFHENIEPGSLMRVVECDAGVGQCFRSALQMVTYTLPASSCDFYAADPNPSEAFDTAVIDQFNLNTVEWSMEGSKPPPTNISGVDLVILHDVLHRHPNLSAAISAAAGLLRESGFLLVAEPTTNFAIPWSLFALAQDVTSMSDLGVRTCGPFCDDKTWLKLFEAAGLETVAVKSDGLLHTTFLCRKLLSYQAASVEPRIIDVGDSTFNWLEEVKAVMSVADGRSVWLTTNSECSGILGMVNCLRMEPNGSRLKCLLDAGLGQSPNAESLQDIYRKDLSVNVWKNGHWGTFRLALLDTDVHRVETEDAYVNIRTRGNLSSLFWLESPLKYFDVTDHPDQQLCRVYYSSLNRRDVMLATGKLNPDVIPDELALLDCLLGMEFSGHVDGGRRVMGLVAAKGLATLTDPYMQHVWTVPDDWTLEQAATVPVAYVIAFYALVVRARIRRGETVLIHCGSSAVGQAAISIALSHDCTVFTTVGSTAKRDYLRGMFPTLTESCFADSRDVNSWCRILREVGRRGVDVILNSLAQDTIPASMQLLAENGRFLEIGKVDLSNNTPLGTTLFMRSISFHGILLEALLKPGNPDWPIIYELVAEGIQSGVVRPLQATVFERDDITSAFQFMSLEKHIGKVLIKIRDENNIGAIKGLQLSAVPRTVCHPRRSYVVVGGLGGMGLELTNWLIERGARHVVVTSRSGVRTGYQRRCVTRWRRAGVSIKVSTLDVAVASQAEQLIREAGENCEGVGGVINVAAVVRVGLVVTHTVEDWIAVTEPKVAGTHNLDAATRKLCCATLEWFVVYSSISTVVGIPGQAHYGYANSAIDRICEQRLRDGLPSLAIQWGPVGDVGVSYERLLGNNERTLADMLPQRISSCLAALDILLRLPHPVVASYLPADISRANKGVSASGGGLRDAAARILGIKNASTVNPDVPLGDLGIDSLMAVEMKQMLEREYRIFVSSQDIRALTFTRLDQLAPSASENVSDPKVKKYSAEFVTRVRQHLIHFLPKDSIVQMNKVHDTSTRLFVVHSIHGSVFMLEAAMSRIRAAKVYGLQSTADIPLTSIPNLASIYIQRMRAIQPRGPYNLAGFSFGTCIAFEMALQLQQRSPSNNDSHDGVASLILLDGSPAVTASHMRSLPSDDNDMAGAIAHREAASIMYFCELLFGELFAGGDESASASGFDKEFYASILAQHDFASRVKFAVSSLIDVGIVSSDSADLLSSVLSSIHHKIVMADDYKPTAHVDSSVLVSLVRASGSTEQVRAVGDDYGLGALCDGKVGVHVVEGSHVTFLQPADDASCKVSELIDKLLSP